MIRVTAERSKGLRVVVKEHLSRSALHELRKTCAGHVAGGLSAVVFCWPLYANALDSVEQDLSGGEPGEWIIITAKVRSAKLGAIRQTD